MTDRDVIERVSAMFGAGIFTIEKGPRRRKEYGTRLKGSRAVMLMADLAPAMGNRRAAAIAAAIDRYSPPDRKLDFATAEKIRELHAAGQSISGLSRAFGVARPTIRGITRGAIYSAPPDTPWRKPHAGTGGTSNGTAAGMSTPELHWLAGWLEGEGSFLPPPPSDPRRPRISAKTCDADVAGEVGRLLGVAPLLSHGERERQRAWSPTWRLLRRGRMAVQVMRAMHPLLGSRRQAQIEAALTTAV